MATTVPIIKIFLQTSNQVSFVAKCSYKIINYKINNAVIRKIISTKR